MTDTGQVPGEGLPENAGGQPEGEPGVPAASGTYTFADPAEAHGGPAPEAPVNEEEDLLMPGAQGAWSESQPAHAHQPAPYQQTPANGVPASQQPTHVQQQPAHQGQQPEAPNGQYAQPGNPAAPQAPHDPQAAQGEGQQPVQDGQFAQDPAYAQEAQPAPGETGTPEQVYEQDGAPQPEPVPVPAPGAHETEGRDSGSIDLGAVRTPQQPAAAPTSAQATPTNGTRRPLHLGPPVPEQSGAVRPLSDRGATNGTPVANGTPANGTPVAAPHPSAGPAHAGTATQQASAPAAAPASAPAATPGPSEQQAQQSPGPQAPPHPQTAQPDAAHPGTPQPEARADQETGPQGAAPEDSGHAPQPAAPSQVAPATPQDQHTTGPEYLDIAPQEPEPLPGPQLGELPQQREEWTAQPQQGTPAETVAPAPEPPAPEPRTGPAHAAPATGTPATGTPVETPASEAAPGEAPAAGAQPEQPGEAVRNGPIEVSPVGEAVPQEAPGGGETVPGPRQEAHPESLATVPAQGTEPTPQSETGTPAEAAPPINEGTTAPGATEAVTGPRPAEPQATAPAAPATPDAQEPVSQQPETPEPAPQPAEADGTADTEIAQGEPWSGPTAPGTPEPQAPAASAPPAQPEPTPATPEGEPTETATPESGTPASEEAASEAASEEAASEEAEAVEEPPALPVGEPAPGYAEAEREAVHRLMRERRDIRNGFRPDPIPHEVLLRVLEAAHTAPSVGHSQPWDFVVIRSEETRRTMHELAERQRDAYAKSLPKGRAKQFKEMKIEAILDTPVNIVVTADPTRGGRHTLGRHTQPQMAPYSSALAVENLWLAARAEGLGVGWVSFFDEREMVRTLELPEHLEVVAYLCVGYVDEFPPEPELMQAGWSKRRPLSWVVHEESYGRRALPGAAPHNLLRETLEAIRPLDAKALGEAWERQKRMTKPSGALGMLEIISAQLCGLSRKCPPPIPEPAAVAVFAGDHGVHAQGVTPWPQEVTAQMVANFLGGGAVCNAFANQVGAEVCVIDVGVASELPATPGLLPRKVRAGTADMTAGPALTREEVERAIEVGIETARDLVSAGNKALLTGEMGIANTTASAALISACTETDPAEVTGRGTGINDETHSRKVEVVRRALDLHTPDPADPIGLLSAVGGLEHAAMVGLILGGASLRTPVVLDGVSAGAAALVARSMAPEALAACIAGHRSAEPGHVAALTKLGLRPLVDLDLRLGEGTGALLALPMVQSAARAMHEVATFDAAGVTEKG